MSKLIDRLDDLLGVYNEHVFASRGGADFYITYSTRHPHATGRRDARATVHYCRDTNGNWKAMDFRDPNLSGTPAEQRARLVAQAQEWANRQARRDLGWKPGPFRNVWMPREVRERVMTDLREAEVRERA